MLDKATKALCPCAAAKPANAVEPGLRLGAFSRQLPGRRRFRGTGVTAAKIFILDTLGVMAAGTIAPSASSGMIKKSRP
jgi:hypothetical protein